MMTTCNCSDLCNYENIMTLIQTIFSVLAVILAWYIPEKIKWNQFYSNLISEYRSYDFAVAVQGVVEFFTIDCVSTVSEIPEKYKERFMNEIYGIQDSLPETLDALKVKVDSKKLFIKDVNKTLHFQRRLLTQFYWELDSCLKSPFVGSKLVKKDFTKGESKIIKILYFMNEAVDNDDLIYKNIRFDEHLPSMKRVKGINKSLVHLHDELKKAKRYIEV